MAPLSKIVRMKKPKAQIPAVISHSTKVSMLMPSSYGFVDGAARYFNFGPQVKVQFGANGQPTAAAVAQFGNLFAAMPSLHIGWSTWCALVLVPRVRHTWSKVLVALYPVITFFCILVTGNHYWVDAVAGLVTLGVGYLLGSTLARATSRWSDRRDARRLAAAQPVGV